MRKTNINKPQESQDPTIVNCRKIEANIMARKRNNLCINLHEKGIQSWRGDYMLNDTIIHFGIDGEDSGVLFIGADESVEAWIQVGDADSNNKYEAFLVAKCDDKRAIVFSLDDLFLYSIAPDGSVGQNLSVSFESGTLPEADFPNTLEFQRGKEGPVSHSMLLQNLHNCSKLSDHIAALLQ